MGDPGLTSLAEIAPDGLSPSAIYAQLPPLIKKQAIIETE